MIIHDTQDKIYLACIDKRPEVIEALTTVRQAVPGYKREIWQFQAAALYCLMTPFNFRGSRILEIGTAWGYSAAVIGQAAPLAAITTLNPHHEEAEAARSHLWRWPNVTVVEQKSTEFFNTWQRSCPPGECMFDVIWVDGDHKRVALDFPYWNLLKPGGLFLFHDFAPEWSSRPCKPVYDGLMRFREWMGRDFDVLISDNTDVGIAGYYQQVGDRKYANELAALAG